MCAEYTGRPGRPPVSAAAAGPRRARSVSRHSSASASTASRHTARACQPRPAVSMCTVASPQPALDRSLAQADALHLLERDDHHLRTDPPRPGQRVARTVVPERQPVVRQRRPHGGPSRRARARRWNGRGAGKHSLQQPGGVARATPPAAGCATSCALPSSRWALPRWRATSTSSRTHPKRRQSSGSTQRTAWMRPNGMVSVRVCRRPRLRRRPSAASASWKSYTELKRRNTSGTTPTTAGIATEAVAAPWGTRKLVIPASTAMPISTLTGAVSRVAKTTRALSMRSSGCAGGSGVSEASPWARASSMARTRCASAAPR